MTEACGGDRAGLTDLFGLRRILSLSNLIVVFLEQKVRMSQSTYKTCSNPGKDPECKKKEFHYLQ